MQRNLMEILQSQMNEHFGFVGVIEPEFDDVEALKLVETGDDDENF